MIFPLALSKTLVLLLRGSLLQILGTLLSDDQVAVNSDFYTQLLSRTDESIDLDDPFDVLTPSNRSLLAVDSFGESQRTGISDLDPSLSLSSDISIAALQLDSNSNPPVEESLINQIDSFIEGEIGGSESGQADVATGQAAPGQGSGEGGEAALGEDQSPSTQRKRGLLLQPIVQNSADQDETQSSSRLLKNLSEGSVLGNNLLDALTLGGGILYALYAPQLVQTSRNSFRTFLSSLQQRINGGTVVMPEKNVASVFVMKRPDGTERLVAARVTASAIDIIAQQDLPSGVSVLQSGTQTQIDYGMKQLLSRISGSSFDLLLIGPRLSNQASLTQSLSSDVQVLDTSGIESRLRSCSEAEVTELRQWLDKPSSTPLDKNPLNDLLSDRQTSMETMLKKEQASMAGLLELSIALSWKDSK